LHGRPDDPVSVLFIDLDKFKAVNDTFGHHVGDELLVKVGLRARRALREGDRLCRLGGDEFVVICPGLDETHAVALAARLRTVMNAPFQIGDVEVLGRISVGIARSGATSTAESILRAADEQMYVDKRRSPTTSHTS
jgi:diguanylate cyclase (GGDEF)-like protein